MLRLNLLTAAALLVSLAVLRGPAMAENEGQDDLDKAAESKDYCQEYQGKLREKGLEITELSTHVDYLFSRHVGIGVGIDYFRTDIDSEKDDFRGSFKWRFAGPSVYLVLSF